MFLLQQGWGMLSAISPFLNNHTNSGVIISPRICEKDQLDKYLPEFKKIGKSKILFDPQFYEPRTDMDRILSYPYFKNFDFNTGSFKAEDFCADVINYQKDYLGLDEIIIPGRFSNGIGEQWLEMNYTFAKTASDIANHKILYSTIAIGPDVISNNESFDSLIDEIINYPVQGIYLVFENRPNSYFIDEEMLYILLDAVLSISLSGKKVLIGFGHQQHLALYAAGMDMLASGNWRNVRSFSLQNFTQQDNENLRKAIWYFDGNSLGEYRLQAISLAFRRGLGNLFGPVTDHAQELLISKNPGAVRWPQNEAFSHYLHLMHSFSNDINNIQKNQRAEYITDFFKQRSDVIKELQKSGFSFGDRGFENACDWTIAALSAFLNDRKLQIAKI